MNTAINLPEVLRLHALWLNGDPTGQRANLSEANLSGANLSEANLSEANLSGADLSRANLSKTILEGKSILSFQFQKHPAYFYGADEIVIGCHRRTVSDWLKNFESIGVNESYTPEQITKYGEFIKLCASMLKK
jgi:hypothetical protein